ncbi:alpha/beta hydrolase [Flavobacteriaceae bacterium M23B6Z8]
MTYFRMLIIFLSGIVSMNAQELIEETIELQNGKIEIPGILSYTDSEKPLPLTIFIHGSGNIDRNGNQAGLNIGANYIKVLADSLNSKGIAFFRYDKRTANPANRKLIDHTISYEDIVEDARIVMKHFAGDDRFSSITVIGHSQGALTSLLAMNEAISKYISLAGASKTLEETVIAQINLQSKELGAIAKQHFEELRKTDTIQEVNFMLQSIFNPVNHTFVKSYNAYLPTEEIAKIKLPTLIINGASDLQITPEDANALKASNPNAELIIIPEMNHVLKTVKDLQENQASYRDASFPLSSELVAVLTEFIKK